MGAKTLINVAAYTGGINVPSARYRVRQLTPKLAQNGVNLTEYLSPVSVYPPKVRLARPFWAAGLLLSRVPSVFSGFKADVILLQREMLSTYVTLEHFTKKPRVLDVDDAIFMYRNGLAARKLAMMSEHVVCGNEFLAEKFGQWNSNVSVLPTAIDTSTYMPKEKIPSAKKTIGWIGTSGNFPYLYEIGAALEIVLTNRDDCILRIISDQRPVFNCAIDDCLEYVKWSPENEIEQLQSMDIGLMPLKDGDWERGKCSFKMLQYMACGVATVVSPVGMNKQVLALGRSGYEAKSRSSWIEHINELLDNDSLRREFGFTGRDVVERHYSHEVIAMKMAAILKKIA